MMMIFDQETAELCFLVALILKLRIFERKKGIDVENKSRILLLQFIVYRAT